MYQSQLQFKWMQAILEELSGEELAAQILMVYSNIEEQMITCYQNLVGKFKMVGPSRRDELNHELKQYWSYIDELSIINGVIFKSDMVVIPQKLRSEMLKQLHIPHMGIEKTNLRARRSMFWPGVNREIEDMVKLCNICIRNQRKQEKEPMKIPISVSWNRFISLEWSEFPVSGGLSLQILGNWKVV